MFDWKFEKTRRTTLEELSKKLYKRWNIDVSELRFGIMPRNDTYTQD